MSTVAAYRPPLPAAGRFIDVHGSDSRSNGRSRRRPPLAAVLCAVVFWLGAGLAAYDGAGLAAAMLAADGFIVAWALTVEAQRRTSRT